ncbi:hypothetical protein LGM42_23770 [Burkholderia sp. AU39826]|uniref:hypothetical protein n=1 Tax=Burkholderia sp. AU39826 TaxID=2879634 RepID=UPI001CF0E20D|nr:hypothetical protein [Burkholderia sp. AU39826]MCA7972896.1 hypothetical protein [Burkholderia sp. AU39826]
MMKRLVVVIAASACAMSAYAAAPNPIDFNVQLAGKVPAPNVFDVKPKGDWDGSNIAMTAPVDWDGWETEKVAEFQWTVKSTYGPVRIKLKSPLHGKKPAAPDFGILLNDSGEFIEFRAAVTKPTGGWGDIYVLNDDRGRDVLTAEDAAKGSGWVGVRLRLKAPNGVPGSGTYTNAMTAIFETGIEG